MSVKEPQHQNTQRGGNITKKKDVEGSFEHSISDSNSLPKEFPHVQGQDDRRETNSDKDMKANPVINLQEFKDDDLISLLQSMEEDYGADLPISSDPFVANLEDELVAKALANLKDLLKMPLKDIAASEVTSFRLQTTLDFLSCLSTEDGVLSHGLEVIIKSMHQDLPRILCSFKQAFGTVNEFKVLEERDKSIKEELGQRKEAAIALVSKMSKTQNFMDEAREKEIRLKEQISRLEKERRECEAELWSLEEQKKKCIAETVEFKKEFESVRKEKLEMEEDQGHARQQLFQVVHEWSALCSQFEQNIADKNVS